MNANLATDAQEAHASIITAGVPALNQTPVLGTIRKYAYATNTPERAAIFHALRQVIRMDTPWVYLNEHDISLTVNLGLMNPTDGAIIVSARVTTLFHSLTASTPDPDKTPTILVFDKRGECYHIYFRLDGSLLVSPASMGKVLPEFKTTTTQKAFAAISEFSTQNRSWLDRLLGRG